MELRDGTASEYDYHGQRRWNGANLKAASIALLDDRGHRVDFHALRTSFIARLQRLGVSPREAMKLARHSDMRLTMKTYTDTGNCRWRRRWRSFHLLV